MQRFPQFRSLLMRGAVACDLVSRYLKIRRRLFRAEAELERERSARRQIEDSLMESEGRLRAIFEFVPECVKLQDIEGLVLQMNPAGLTALEADSPEEVIGLSVYRYIEPEYREPYRRLSEQAFQGKPGSMEFRAVSLKGTVHMLESYMVPLRDARGNISSVLGLTRDITERRLAEERSHQHLAELAHVARVSTMGEMATNIAHELNQPLTAIVNFASASIRLIKKNTDARVEVLENLERIVEQGKRGGQIIRQIRGFVAKGELKVAPVDINGVANTILDFVEPEARQRNVTVRLRLAEGLPPVRAEKIEIEQILLNLVKNGIEAMGDTAVPDRSVTIETRVVLCSTHVEVTVRDSGPGVPVTNRDKIFDPFFTTKTEGMGLGISISRSIVQAHHGQFWLDTEVPFGATFRFTLPIYSEGQCNG